MPEPGQRRSVLPESPFHRAKAVTCGRPLPPLSIFLGYLNIGASSLWIYAPNLVAPLGLILCTRIFFGHKFCGVNELCSRTLLVRLFLLRPKNVSSLCSGVGFCIFLDAAWGINMQGCVGAVDVTKFRAENLTPGQIARLCVNFLFSVRG